jgi:dTDP-4-dehydrorhamnose reductase
MSQPLVIVTGANGQLGKELRALASSYPSFRFVFLGREDLPIHHFPLVRNFFEAYHPAFCINCAAYTAVDKAESEKDVAFLVNAESVGVLAAVCKEFGTRLVHVSTDYVFDGSSETPYLPNATTGPINTYGTSKLEGEQLCLKENPDSLIIRTSWVYSEFGNNFVKTMVKLMSQRESLNVVDDQVGAPTYAADLANAILSIISQQQWKPGIYHYSNQGKISWYQFAQAIARHIHSNCKVNPIPSSAYPTPARRPSFSLLDTTSLQQDFSIQIPGWEESLLNCLRKLDLPVKG